MGARRLFLSKAFFSLASLLLLEKAAFAVDGDLEAAFEEPEEIVESEEVSGAKEIEEPDAELEKPQEFVEDFGGQDAFEPQDAYKSFLDSVNRIRMFKAEEDVFLAASKDSGNRTLTSSAKGKTQRRFYDESLRLEKIEYWKTEGSSANSSLERSVTFNEPSKQGGLRSVFEKNYAESTETRTFFRSDGQIKSRRKNFFSKDGLLESFEIFTCAYDSSGRIVQERLQKYSVDKKNVKMSGDELKVTKYSGKSVYETSYYKNSILRVRTFYLDGKEDEYVRATYFDGGIIARDFYRGNIKVSSTIDKGDNGEN